MPSVVTLTVNDFLLVLFSILSSMYCDNLLYMDERVFILEKASSIQYGVGGAQLQSVDSHPLSGGGSALDVATVVQRIYAPYIPVYNTERYQLHNSDSMILAKWHFHATMIGFSSYASKIISSKGTYIKKRIIII